MNHEELKQVILSQQEEMTILPENYASRSMEEKVENLAINKEIIVLSGVRRCGKSVLLNKALHQQQKTPYYLNFEDDRLVTFSVTDFQKCDEIFFELFGKNSIYFFDEIQNIEGWEMYVRRLHNAGKKIYITGSNATLFSEELGTRLTGRYISLTIYPFSFYEFLHFLSPAKIKKNYSSNEAVMIKKAFDEYVEIGGFPEFIKYRQSEYLHSLYESIIYRDIISRYKIANAKILRELLYFLASQCGKETTFSSLRKLVGIKSVTTISEYCGYFEASYLCFLVSRYAPSIKARMQLPKKVYFIDTALAKTISFRVSEDKGRMYENIIYLELRRRKYEIYYHRADKECDFIIRHNRKITIAMQVCVTLENHETKQREIDGLVEAMSHHFLSEGYILTERENDTIHISVTHQKYTIHVMPIWKWLLESATT